MSENGVAEKKFMRAFQVRVHLIENLMVKGVKKAHKNRFDALLFHVEPDPMNCEHWKVKSIDCQESVCNI